MASIILLALGDQLYIMLELLNEGAITMDDLKDFSDELKEMMKHFSNR